MGLISSLVEKAIKIHIFRKKWAGGGPRGGPDFTGKFEAPFKPTISVTQHSSETHTGRHNWDVSMLESAAVLLLSYGGMKLHFCDRKVEITGKCLLLLGAAGRWRAHGNIQTCRLQVKIDWS